MDGRERIDRHRESQSAPRWRASTGTTVNRRVVYPTIDKQDGRRFSGTFSSARSTEAIIGVISHTGTLFLVDSDGYGYGTLLGPDKLESCYLRIGANGRVASCTVLTKQP
jgi:hypothetical protein